MKDCFVIFDTNTYRTFISANDTEETKKRFQKLKSIEQSKNIKALLCPVVAMELYSHLGQINNIGSVEYNVCKNSAIAQFEHSFDSKTVREIAISDINLCNLIFNQTPDKVFEEQKKVLRMSQHLYVNNSIPYLKGYTENFKEINKFVSEKEKNYTQSLFTWYEEYCNRPHEFNPDEEFYGHLPITKMALVLLYRAANILNINLNDLRKDEIKSKLEIIKLQFKTTLVFHINVIKSIIHSAGEYKFEDPKKGNHYWDTEISFYIGSTIENKKVILVTDDKKLHTASKETNLDDRVIGSKEYFEKINCS